jgi:hypothetical protein
MKLTGAAILVSRGVKFLQAAPAAYPYRSSDKIVRRHMSESNEIPEHESPVRRMMADAHGTPFHPLRTLDEAQQHDDGVAILQGDWGGQIYAVIPVRMIRCSTNTLQQLLLDLDTEAWSCNENEGASIYYERVNSKGPGLIEWRFRLD